MVYGFKMVEIQSLQYFTQDVLPTFAMKCSKKYNFHYL